MKILVIGGGGREHALIWKLRQNPLVRKIYCAPGNAGIAELAECVSVRVDDLEGCLSLAKKEKIDLTVVGPELPLTLGLVDLFQREGLPIFGPNRDAAILEGSKAWTKQFLREEEIPTAAFETFDNFDRAMAYLKPRSYPQVIKADGLAAGKGVVIAQNETEAREALELVLKKKIFGEAGRRIVIEEFLEGVEASFMALVDGSSLLPLDSAQDHKRAGEGDTGPNTGGMGAYSPAPVVTESVQKMALERILQPTLKGLQKRGLEFRGILYAGLMIGAEGPKLLEYNVRLGDPETQPLMMRLESNLVEAMQATLSGKLKSLTLRWKAQPSVTIVMAAHGYPGEVRTGDVIEGLERAATLPETMIFHSGTRREGDKIVTAGGRVLGVTSLGKDLRQARERAYDAVEKIYFKGMHYRRDIGLRAGS